MLDLLLGLDVAVGMRMQAQSQAVSVEEYPAQIVGCRTHAVAASDHPTKMGRRDSRRGVLAGRSGLPSVSAVSLSTKESTDISTCAPSRGRIVKLPPETSFLPTTRAYGIHSF